MFCRCLFWSKELEDAALGPQGMVGWYDSGARMYNPRLGRWLAQDPLMQFCHPYLFCANNPACYRDLYGLWTPINNGYYTDDSMDIMELMLVLKNGVAKGDAWGWIQERVAYDALSTTDVVLGTKIGVALVMGKAPSGAWQPRNLAKVMDWQAWWVENVFNTPDPYMAATMMMPSVVEFGTGFLKDTRAVLGDNGKLYGPGPSGRVFPGNKSTKVYSIGKWAKATGRVMAAISAGVTFYQVSSDISNGHPIKATARATYATLTGAANFIPYVGPFISLGMSAVEGYYGERMYQWIEDQFVRY